LFSPLFFQHGNGTFQIDKISRFFVISSLFFIFHVKNSRPEHPETCQIKCTPLLFCLCVYLTEEMNRKDGKSEIPELKKIYPALY